MSALRTILKNVGSNSLGYLVNAIVGLVLARFVRESLGNSVWGAWNLVVSFVGYYGLLDVGIRSAVGHYVATYHARHDAEAVNRTLSTAMAFLLGVAAFACLITVVVAWNLTTWFPSVREAFEQAGDVGQAKTVLLIMGFGFALSFPMALYGTVIYSVQRIDLQNVIGISQVLLRALLTVWVLKAGHGVIGLAAIVVATNVLGWAASIFFAYRVLPELALAFHSAARRSLRELASYGSFNVLVNVGDTVLLYTSILVVGRVYDDSIALAWYGVASMLVPYYMQVVQSITWAVTPHVTARWATGHLDEVRRIFVVGTRGVLVFASLLAGGLLFLGKGFLTVWQGPEWVVDGIYPSCHVLLGILTVATLLRAAQSCGRQVLFAMREVRYLGLVVIAEAIANVLLSVILMRRFGLIGVALGTLIPVIVTQGFVQPRHLLRELEVDWKAFLLDNLRASLPILATMGAVHYALGDHLAITSWATFFARGFVVTLPALVVGFFTGLLPEERQALLQRLIPKPKVR